MRRPTTLALALAMIVAACGGSDDATETTETIPPADTTSSTEPSTTGTPPGTDDAPDETVEHTRSDLAGRLAVDAAEIEVVSHEDVTWEDGALGCPEPGQMYTQALVEGSLTILAVDGIEYRYHAGRDGDPFLCEDPALEYRDGGSGTTEGPPES